MSRQLLDAEFARLGVRIVNGVDMALRWRFDGHVSEWAGPYVSIPMVRLCNATP